MALSLNKRWRGVLEGESAEASGRLPFNRGCVLEHRRLLEAQAQANPNPNPKPMFKPNLSPNLSTEGVCSSTVAFSRRRQPLGWLRSWAALSGSAYLVRVRVRVRVL